MRTIFTILWCLSVCFIAFDEGRIVLDTVFQWKNGTWGPCVAFKNHCGYGERERDIWCRDVITEEIETPDACEDKIRPNSTEPCYIPCKRHKETLNWHIGEWGPCQVAQNVVLEYGMGLMQRSVTCVLTSDSGLEEPIEIDFDNCAFFNPTPESVQRCTLPFKQDCVTTEFTKWSICCDGYQYRTRTILRQAQNGGEDCPELSEFKKCEEQNKLCADTSKGYRWKIGDWGECLPKSVTKVKEVTSENVTLNYLPKIGTQRRKVECINSTGELVSNSWCALSHPQPILTKSCIVDIDCMIGSEGEWTIIRRGCVTSVGKVIPQEMKRQRTIVVAPSGNGLPCPSSVEIQTKTDQLPPCTDLVKWQITKWSDCLSTSTNKKVECGGGLQHRNITCIDVKSGQPLPNSDCHFIDTPSLIQRCEMACPRDCEVTEWAPWGPCLPTQCPSKTDGTEEWQLGVRKRFRSVVVPPSDFGMECPSLIESQPCRGIQCFMWSAGTWGSCQTMSLNTRDSLRCGPGKRTRQVFCITYQKEIVEDYKCNQMKKPSLEESCSVPCPYDCVASPWSEWSSCSKSCTNGTSIGYKYRNRTIIAPQGRYGAACPKPEELQQIEKCNEHGCEGYSWLTLPWQTCNTTCGNGVQYREVWCLRNNENRVDDVHCKHLPYPIESRTCMVECKQTCRLSEWSEWSECPPTYCPTEIARLKQLYKFSTDYKPYDIRYQRRTRIALDGIVCGHLEELKRCSGADEPCPVYRYIVGKWSNCQLPSNMNCGEGYRNRELKCWSEEDKAPVPMDFCYMTNSTITMPETIQKCNINCGTSCTVTEWSSWTSCEPGMKVRTRYRQFIGGPADETCNYLHFNETEPCPLDEYHNEMVGEWSPCIINGTSTCGIGLRYIGYGCYNWNAKVDPLFCGYESGLSAEECEIKCPIDCKMGEWTEWSKCSSKCGPGTQIRERQVIQTPLYGGRKCESIFQQKPCDIPCSNFQWQESGWSSCRLEVSGEKECGIGEQYRKVWCMDITVGTEVNEEYCDWTTKSEEESTCHIACPGDCVISEWSEWSVCAKGCSMDQQQQRTRALLRSNSSTGAACLHSIQTRACELNKTCFTYNWTATPYSSCLPLGGSSCGEGIISRMVFCQRSDGRAVDDSFCEEELRQHEEERWCYIDCPVDCEFGGWTPWNVTECKCNDTAMSREGWIRTNDSPTGRKCFDNLVQWMPCPQIPCYEWVTGDWSTCQLEVGSCGHGYMQREVKCMRPEDGKHVEDKNCLKNEQRPADKEKCYVPCVTRCQLASWSDWSPCHGDCREERIGYQSRAREVIQYKYAAVSKACPDPLWETRDCEITSCPTFQWKVTKEGKVTCERSDGIVVESGCEESDRPKFKCISYDDRCLCTNKVEVKAQNGICPDVGTEVDNWVSAKRIPHHTEQSLSSYEAISAAVIIILIMLVIFQAIWYYKRIFAEAKTI